MALEPGRPAGQTLCSEKPSGFPRDYIRLLGWVWSQQGCLPRKAGQVLPGEWGWLEACRPW